MRAATGSGHGMLDWSWSGLSESKDVTETKYGAVQGMKEPCWNCSISHQLDRCARTATRTGHLQRPRTGDLAAEQQCRMFLYRRSTMREGLLPTLSTRSVSSVYMRMSRETRVDRSNYATGLFPKLSKLSLDFCLCFDLLLLRLLQLLSRIPLGLQRLYRT